VEEAMGRIRAVDDHPRVWFVGHWGFQYYALREGMQPISAYSVGKEQNGIPMPPQSELKKGDWLVLPPWDKLGANLAGWVHSQDYWPDAERPEHFDTVTIADRIPLRTIITLYSGATAVEYHDGARLEVEIRRVTEDHLAEPAPPPPKE